MPNRNTMFLLFFTLKCLIFLPLSISSELKEHDALCAQRDSCYAVFYQRLIFREAWKACRDRGGNLATVKNAQEAALVEQLLTSSAGSRSDRDLQLRLWIGLQRQPRQCAPQKPLRGFTWTTGDQDTAFTNWVSQSVSAGPPSSCSAARCVAIGLGYGKPEDDFKWLEGSCTLPVDGFVCKFRYQGMCPALTEETVRYSVPFGYQGTWLDLVPFGTVAVVSCDRQQPDLSVLCMLKEDGTVGWNNDGPLCQNPEDLQCQGCQQLCEGGVCACHEGYILQLDGQSCEPEDDDPFEDQGCRCQYQCVGYGTGGKGYQCICPEGYELAADERSCEDVDECEDDEKCDHSCQNTLGSYTCSCDLGFAISEDDHERCVDIDECRIAHMCQQMCVNYLGGFECFCSEGYELDVDRVSCNAIQFREPVNLPEATFINTFEQEPNIIDTVTDGWYWHLVNSETTSTTVTDIPIIPFKEETTTVLPTKEEPTEEMTPSLDLESHEYIANTPTVMPDQSASREFMQDKVRRNTFQTTSPKVHILSSIIPPLILSTKTPTENSKVNIWLGTKVTSEVPNTAKHGTIKASWEMSKISTMAPSTPMVNDLSPTMEIPEMGVDTITNNMPSPGLPQSNSDDGTVSPNPSQESSGKRDNRWLVVALLVPLCIFLVVMLALGIVYCTRCGGETKPRSVTDCYHWVTGSGPEKGLSPIGVETPSSRVV
ncbi:endosialin [Pseudophryne corroboree]|uniref:endosialin n=1 Tax=Pseudophryne corroboree TaxID=495146 RepID=UPI003081FC52